MSSESELERLLREARATLPEPDAASSRQARAGALAAIRRRRPRRLSVAALLGVALIVAVGLGVALGTLIAPRGVAANRPVGVGFLPEEGWFVLQTGGDATPDRPALAVAANVPFHPDDAARGSRDSSGLPYSTLLQLPPRGVVIVASFRVRGFESWLDASYPARTLPLRMADAVPYSEFGTQVRPKEPLGQYQLHASVNGHHVDLQFYFGTAHPSRRMIGAAQRQLGRLVVASERVTIFARPTVLGWAQSGTLFGSVDSGSGGEMVRLQERECGRQFFRVFAEVETRDGGGWSTSVGVGITSTFRAIWRDFSSSQVTIRARATVVLEMQPPGSRLRVTVTGRRDFWQKSVLIQRREGGAWKTLKKVVLTDSLPAAGIRRGSEASFRLSVPEGTLIRAVLPRSQARPCYLPSVSKTLRT